MTETHSDMRPGTWQVPECPLLIEYPPALLDEIRLAVVDAFFSIPRGGAETGGILFGRHSDTGVRIEAFRPMECEHAKGPTFVLSNNDRAKLRQQLAEAPHDPLMRGLEVVGWYHSHTRSEIFLSDLDLEIYSSFFPQPWQVALVLRPAGMKPTRAGFFFRDRDGAVRSSASYHEFIAGADGQTAGNGRVEAAAHTPIRQTTPEPAPPPEPAPAAAPPDPDPPADERSVALLPSAAAVLQRVETSPARRVVEVAPPIEMRPAEFVPPAFMLPPAQKPSRMKWWLALGLAAVLGAGAWFTSGYWMHWLAPKPVYLHLQALDRDGQLRIQWDQAAMASADAQAGSLEIVDGAAATTIPLDGIRLRAGSFQYARRSDVVEVHLVVKTTRGVPIEEFTSFYGHQRPPANAADRGQDKPSTNLAAEAERARGDLKKQELRTLEAERALERMREQVRRDEERKRVENQIPAGGPPSAAERPPAVKPPAAPTQTANNVNQAPQRSNPPPSSAPAVPATPNAAPQEKPQAVAQTLVPQAARPLAPPPDRTPQVSERQPPPPAPAAAAQPVSKPAPTPPPQPSLSGRWVYSPAAKSGSAYQPESVTLMLAEAYNQLNGTFIGRYKIPKNIKMNPKVSFDFHGPLQAGSSKFNFTAADGSRGHVELIPLPGKQNAIEVVWYSERDKLTFDDIFYRVP